MEKKITAEKYAEAINREHEQAHLHAQTAIDHAIRCGELLIAQKKRVKHGEFVDWIKLNCTFSPDTANIYMRATRKKTRGLVFSSLAELLAYEREERRQRPERFLHQELKTPDFGLPSGHDASAWAYSQAATKLLRDIANHVRYLDPHRVALGALLTELDAIDASARVVQQFVAELRNGIGCAQFGKPITPIHELSDTEFHTALWGEGKQNVAQAVVTS